MEGQLNLFTWQNKEYSVDKPLRLVELFAGIGAQAMALRDLGTDYETQCISEWNIFSNRSYRAIHCPGELKDRSEGMGFDEVVAALCDIGISTDGKSPLSEGQIKRRGEEDCRRIYSEFRATRNIGSIINRKGADLGITDTDKYEYIMTYSYPCQDLSVAGKGKGMAKGSGTRSSLLWEVERMLGEMDELPQILVMENVPMVHSSKNAPEFTKWLDRLKEMGYSNFWQDLNAKRFGIPQNRERTFMVSILGDWKFSFPKSMDCRVSVASLLEEKVDERYYMPPERARQLIANSRLEASDGLGGQVLCKLDKKYRDGAFQTLQDCGLKTVGDDTAGTVLARYYKGVGGNGDNMVMESDRVERLGGIYESCHGNYGNVYGCGGVMPTLRSGNGFGTAPIIAAIRGRKTWGCEAGIGQRLEVNSSGASNSLTTVQKDNMVVEGGTVPTDVIINDRGFSNNEPRVSIGVSPTLRAQSHRNPPKVVEMDSAVRIRQATKQGYIECEPGGLADFSYPNSYAKRGRVQDGGHTPPALMAGGRDVSRAESELRIRKLTPRECWRLMGFSDLDFDRASEVCSDTQLYMQAGNSIVRNLMAALFSQLNIPGVKPWNERTDEEKLGI